MIAFMSLTKVILMILPTHPVNRQLIGRTTLYSAWGNWSCTGDKYRDSIEMKPMERVDTRDGIDEKQDMGGLGWAKDGMSVGVMETRNKSIVGKEST